MNLNKRENIRERSGTAKTGRLGELYSDLKENDYLTKFIL